MYDELKGLLTSTDFGTDVDFTVDSAGMAPSQLAAAGVDVFLGGAVPGGYSVSEEQALMAWIQAGGVYIAMANTQAYDILDFLPGTPALVNLPAVWEPGDHAVRGQHPDCHRLLHRLRRTDRGDCGQRVEPGGGAAPHGHARHGDQHPQLPHGRVFDGDADRRDRGHPPHERVHADNVGRLRRSERGPGRTHLDNNIDGPTSRWCPSEPAARPGCGARVADGHIFASNYSAMPRVTARWRCNNSSGSAITSRPEATDTADRAVVDATYVTLLGRSADQVVWTTGRRP